LNFAKLNGGLIAITAVGTLISWMLGPKLWTVLFGKPPPTIETPRASYEVNYRHVDSNTFKLGLTNSPSLPQGVAGVITNLFVTPTSQFPGTNRVTLHYTDDTLGYLFVKGSIRGVTGEFVIDTGCCEPPVLSLNCARACGIPLGNKTNVVHILLGVEIQVTEATDITIELSPGLTIRWPTVWVDMADRPWLGIIDYPTLELFHAVIDTEKRTIDMFPNAPVTNVGDYKWLVK
jgi:hypothetical protein